MIHIIFYNKSADVLLYGWSSPTLRIIMGIEIIAIIVGITVGIFAPKNRLTNIFIFIVGGVGLLLVLKNIVFGLSSDAEIPLPFIGESLLVGATIAFCMRLRKK